MSFEKSLEKSIGLIKNFYNQTTGSGIYQKEFTYYCMERWISEGHVNNDTDLNELFMFDVEAIHCLSNLGWCEAQFFPEFECEVLEDRGEHELVRDFAGRSVLFFKNRRNGFMPEYVDHPVKDMKTWEKDVKWRLDPNTPDRLPVLKAAGLAAKEAAGKGLFVCQKVVGGYMYLRSLMGPEQLLYQFYDAPELVHACMKAWLELADKVTAEHQKYVNIDELFLAEDICYKSGSLISPDAMREFLFPYYQQLITNIKSRQLDKNTKLNIQIDTDGFCIPVIDLYKTLGMNYMSPFEVASNCDVVQVRKDYPDLLISGGIDKRILAKSKDAIDAELERIMPFMKKHGGYIPTCDHGVPEEVSFENYMHYRKRMVEYSK